MPPIATILLAPPRYPSQNTPEEKKKREKKIEGSAICSSVMQICTNDTILRPHQQIPSLLFVDVAIYIQVLYFSRV